MLQLQGAGKGELRGSKGSSPSDPHPKSPWGNWPLAPPAKGGKHEAIM